MFESLSRFFPHLPLLGGVLLVGVPIVIHLIMRQRPKHVLFPAFRFLAQKFRTNQRKLQLRHLILLLLRILLILLLCLALAGTRIPPDLFGKGFVITSGQPIAVAVVIDTSPSMEYLRANKSRLADAQQHALELLEDLPDDSRVAVFDTADAVSGHWAESLPQARKTIADLQIRPGNRPVTDVLEHAYNLLAAADARSGGEPLPRFLYVFSDRTRASWDAMRVPPLVVTRDHIKGPKVQGVYVDVGEKQPTNLAVVSLKLPRQALAANETLILDATVQATGRAFDTGLLCRIDDSKEAERKPFKLSAGQSQTFRFERTGLKPGLHRAVVSLDSPDNVPSSALRFATFEVRAPRLVLTISDNLATRDFQGDPDYWQLALNKHGAYRCEVVSTHDTEKLTAENLAKYQAVCLLDVARPSHELWEKLFQYVKRGGGLIIIPGGVEVDQRAYTEDEFARQLMPGKLHMIVDSGEGAAWKIDNTQQHPLLAPFRAWMTHDNFDSRNLGRAYSYWAVKKLDNDLSPIVRYTDKDAHPALLERSADKKLRGTVLLFTTPMDGRRRTNIRSWNDYITTPFFIALANKAVGYVTGDDLPVQLNFPCGQTVPIELPGKPHFPSFTLTDLRNGTVVVLPRPEGEDVLRIPPDRAAAAASYRLAAPKDWETGFSLNVPEDEFDLARVPKEAIEQLFGEKAVLEIEPTDNLRNRLESQWGSPVSLFPWLMILLLLVLAVENLLGNRFYRREVEANKK